MRLDLALPADVSIALRKLSNEEGLAIEIAVVFILSEWLIGNGYLELRDELTEDTPTEGSA